MEKVLSNQAMCLDCGEEIYSTHVHDFKNCRCGNIFVDGGMEYIRHGFQQPYNYLNRSITVDEIVYEVALSSIDWALDNDRNSLGILCALARGLRDCGYYIKQEDYE